MAVTKILCACGIGLGTSVVMQMNVDDVLHDLGLTGIEVGHAAVEDLTSESADLFVLGQELLPRAAGLPSEHVVALVNVLDKDELRGRLLAAL